MCVCDRRHGGLLCHFSHVAAFYDKGWVRSGSSICHIRQRDVCYNVPAAAPRYAVNVVEVDGAPRLYACTTADGAYLLQAWDLRSGSLLFCRSALSQSWTLRLDLGILILTNLCVPDLTLTHTQTQTTHDKMDVRNGCVVATCDLASATAQADSSRITR